MPFLQVQPRLAAESDFVQRLLSTAHSIVVFVDPAARIVLFNDYMRELGGHGFREVVGQDWFDCFVPEPEREQLRAKFRGSVECDDMLQSHVCPVACPIMTRRGDVRRIEWEVNAVRAADGELLGLLGIGQDVTEKRALRTKLAESERLASIGMMASVLAHEVGNPLNAIHLQIQILRRLIDRPDRGPLVPRIDSILSEITRLNSLLDDFRAYRDSSAMLLTRTDLGAVIPRVLELLAVRAAEQHVSLACEVAPALPHVLGNGTKLEQVFLNLCKNAIEAMPEGGNLKVCARTQDELVHVDVIDDGPGLPTHIDVFEPFTTTKPCGMGLGLPLAREIVAAHGGTLSCASAPARGTTFTVSLPARPAERAYS